MEKIYLQKYNEEGEVVKEITWSEDRINENDVEYILSTIDEDKHSSPYIKGKKALERLRSR